MKGIKIIPLLVITFFIFLFSGVSSHGHIDWSVNTSQDPQYQQLYQEISQPIPSILEIQDENLIRLRTVIGYLPVSEQNALALSYQAGGDRVFNIYTYLSKSSSDKVYKSTYSSLSSLLTTNSKMFRYGLGCVKKVSVMFGESNETNDYAKLVYDHIATLLNSQIQVNNCESRFVTLLASIMVYRKRFLLTTIINQLNTATYSDPDTKKIISGFKYLNYEVSAVVDAFKTYATCHHSFRHSVFSRVLESEQMIGKLSGCTGEKNPNAGMSSRVRNSTINIVKNEKDEVIGKNLGFGVRTDLRTQNNYLLQGGFGYGNLNLQTLNSTGQSLLMYPSIVQAQITTVLNSIKNRTDDFTILYSKMSTNLLYNATEYRPVASLHDLVLTTTYVSNVDQIKAELAKVERGESCDGDYMFYCIDGNCKCSGTLIWNTQTCPNNLNFKVTISSPMSSQSDFDSINIDHDYTFSFKTSFISSFCLNKVRYIYSEATNRILGKQIDFIVGGKPNIELGALFSGITQGCFGVFTNGSKDDKDTCRDVFNEKCGIEMDYRCKQSGLYDYINQNPVSSKIFPVECDKGLSTYKETTCFNWIAQNLFLGTIALKTTGFLSLNLNIQASVNQGNLPTNTEPVEYFTKDDDDPTLTDSVVSTALANYASNITLDIVVDGASYHYFPRFSDYLMDIDHEALAHEQTGAYIKISLITMIFIFFFGLIV